MGVFTETVAKLRLLPEVHQVVEPGKGRFQVGRLQGGVQALGRAQEQARYELRNDGTCSQVRTNVIILLYRLHSDLVNKIGLSTITITI